jgi:hypothetical protein
MLGVLGDFYASEILVLGSATLFVIGSLSIYFICAF